MSYQTVVTHHTFSQTSNNFVTEWYIGLTFTFDMIYCHDMMFICAPISFLSYKIKSYDINISVHLINIRNIQEFHEPTLSWRLFCKRYVIIIILWPFVPFYFETPLCLVWPTHQDRVNKTCPSVNMAFDIKIVSHKIIQWYIWYMTVCLYTFCLCL